MDEHYRVGMDMRNGYHMELEWTEWMNITELEWIYKTNIWNECTEQVYMEQIYGTVTRNRYTEQICGTDIRNGYAEQRYMEQRYMEQI